jgi:hypothetical protein
LELSPKNLFIVYMEIIRMNKSVQVLIVLAIMFTAMQLLTWDTADAGKKYPRIKADAGNDFKVLENQEVNLDGSGSKGGFKNNNEPIEINNDDKPKASFTAPDVSGEATYEFQLKVRDEVDREDDDVVTVHVMNQQAPVGPT